jgi:hypothetical protein
VDLVPAHHYSENLVSSGNKPETLICSQDLRPLDHGGGLFLNSLYTESSRLKCPGHFVGENTAGRRGIGISEVEIEKSQLQERGNGRAWNEKRKKPEEILKNAKVHTGLCSP